MATVVEQTIDIDAILKGKMGTKAKFVPGFLVRWLKRIAHQDQVNAFLWDNRDKTGVDWLEACVKYLDMTLEVEGKENLPDPSDGRLYTFVSNHPLGGEDGVALGAIIGRHYDGRFRYLVNDLLMAVEPLRSIFLPVNKYGAQRRSVVEEIEAQYAGDNQMITFPAGLCSRRTDSGRIHDLEWKKFVVTHAVRHHRDVIPIFFDEVNSDLFYFLARLRERLGFKFNAEMIMLPREMIRREGDTLHFHIGRPIPWTTLDEKNARAETERICEITYSLGRKSK